MSKIGKNFPRDDVYGKVTGEACYVSDLNFPGTLHAKILHSEFPHAKILGINLEKAKRLKGVIRIITHQDVPKIRYNPATYPLSEIPGRMVLPKDMYMITDKARYIGDPVAAVVATHEDIAEEAIEMMQVHYESLNPVFSIFEAMQEGATLIHDDLDSNIVHEFNIEHGDIDTGFSDSEYIVEEEFTTSRVSAAPLDIPWTSFAITSSDGKVIIYSSTQTPHLSKRVIGEALGIKLSHVRLIIPCIGGGFGLRHGLTNELITAFLSIITRKPVKLSFSREESFMFAPTRSPIWLKIKSGVKKDGTLLARRLNVITDIGPYAYHGVSLTRLLGLCALSLYRCKHLCFNGKIVYTNNPINSAMRGYGNPQGNFALESHMDTIAHKIGIDPLEFRLKNHIKKGDTNLITNLAIDSCGLEECIREGAKKIDWNTRSISFDKNKRRGKGMAIMIHISGGRPGITELSTASILINEDGVAYLNPGVSEIGQGTLTGVKQIACEVLGFKYEDVILSNTVIDTNVDAFNLGAYGSRQIFSNGNAVIKAAIEVREKMLDHASELLQIDKNQLMIEDSMVKYRVTHGELLSMAQVSRSIIYKTGSQQIIGVGICDVQGNSPPFAAHFAEVEVDLGTGLVEVIRFVAAHDVGQAINPSLIEGQIEGGVIQGIGYALIENIVVNEGRVINPCFADYKVLTSLDIPNIQSIIVEDPSPIGPYGAKGVGEPGLVPTAAAISNAIYNAIGVRIPDLPITPEKILQALDKKNQREVI